ncbi:MAG: hypothetical protein ABFD62_01730 [Syntrophaceae bacterium]
MKKKLVPIFVPSLIAILLNGEEIKGECLTREEAEAIRDKSYSIMLPESMLEVMKENRGYQDINPDNCWEEYMEIRSAREHSAH